MFNRFRRSVVRSAWFVSPVVAALVLLTNSVVAQRDPIDFNRAREIRERFLRGDAVSKEERAYLERAKAEFQNKQGSMPKGTRAVGKDSLDLRPLVDFKPNDRYKEQAGGLYGSGQNEPPAPLAAAAKTAAAGVVPRDAEGKPSPQGKVVLISVGMSNTTQEFRRFMTLANRDAAKSPSLVLIDGAQGGMEASTWATPEKAARPGRPDPWSVLDQRLKQNAVSPKQVQVAWIKQARANPVALGDFPKHSDTLKANLETIVAKLKERFPNLALIYLSSRIYAGYAGTMLNPEPFAYESAFSVRSLILEQPALKHDATKTSTHPPVLLWGPYLWADGVKGRKSDSLVWKREDLADDGTHPSPSGQQKVADLLLRFFKTNPTARPWFTAPSSNASR